MTKESTEILEEMFESGEIEEILDSAENIQYFNIQKKATALLAVLGK